MKKQTWQRLGWFVLFWIAGVAAITLVGSLIRWAIL